MTSRRAALAADLLGALNGAAATFTITIASATLVFAPLGPQWLAQGFVACLIATVIGGLLAAALSSTPVTICSPRAAASLVLAAFVGAVQRDLPTLSPLAVVALASATVVFAGALQIVTGLLRLGQLVRYVPFPVIAGFTHGIALLLIAVYIPVFLGVASVPRIGWFDSAIVPGAALVGAVTLLVAIACSRWNSRLPALFLGLVAGIAVYTAIAAWNRGMPAGAILDTSSLPSPAHLAGSWADLAGIAGNAIALRHVASFGIALAIVASVDALVGAMVIETRYGVRAAPDRDLIAQGAGNVVAGGLGGAVISYSAVQVLSAYAAGARGRATSIATPLLVLALAAITIQWGLAIPLAALAALMILVAIRLADPWAFALLRTAWRTRADPAPLVRNSLIVYVLVALSVVALGIISALAVGIAVAAVIFLRTANEHVLRRVLTGKLLRSRRLFPAPIAESLDAKMDQVAVMELQGPLFFGTADRIVEEVARLTPAIRYVVLDMRRVQALDETALAVLGRLAARLRAQRRQFVVCGRPEGTNLVDGASWTEFPDRDRAIEWVEEQLLAEAAVDVPQVELQPEALAAQLQVDERAAQALGRHGRVIVLPAGGVVFRAGDASDELYFLLSGRASILYEAAGVRIRVVTFLPGSLFGDVAFVDGKPRSADAICEVECRLLVLDREAIPRMEAEVPGVAVQVYAGLASDIAGRLRAADHIVRDLL